MNREGTARSRETIFGASIWKEQNVVYSEYGLDIGPHQVMQYWERPIMRQLAFYATRKRGRILELGFRLGISADYIMEFGCDDYWVVEPHPKIATEARAWGGKQSTPVTVIEDFWQNVLESLGRFDGIVFDTFPLDPKEKTKNHYAFIPVAATLLKDGGAVTYYSDETRNFRLEHLDIIFEHFNRVEFAVVDNLSVPECCNYWRADHMVIPCLSWPRSR
jgi:guanidinoacetate N-methyltransferase